MQFHLKKILPKYFEQNAITGSDIWLKEVVFPQGKKIQIVAPSGSGKTSLIHFLYGLRSDFDGEIFFNHSVLSKGGAEHLSAVRRNDVSIVFQDLRLFEEQSVMQNLEIKRQLNPYCEPEYVVEMVNRLGLKSKLDTPVKICSYGERQRVAIIRALLQPFTFLLLDEPFSHLDDDNRTKALELIVEETHKRKASLVLADLHKADDVTSDHIFYL